MKVLTTIIGIIILPFQMIFLFVDPVLRYFESALNLILNFIIGTIVDFFNWLPNIFFISLGELILSSINVALFFIFYDYIPFINTINNIYYQILLGFGVFIIGYFLIYFIINFLIDWITSLFSILIVLLRLSIYLPKSILLSLIKLFLLGLSTILLIFFFGDIFFINTVVSWVYGLLILLGINIFFSIFIMLITANIKYHHLGNLDSLEISNLKTYNKSIGIYIMTNGVIPVYIGRAIEFRNGGFRKRISDYIRESDSSRKHTSGQLIHAMRKDLDVHLIEMGNSENEVDFIKEAETTLISHIFTSLNEQDTIINYIVNIVGYLLGGTLLFISGFTLKGTPWLMYLVFAFALINTIVCIVLYIIQNADY